MLGSGQQEVPHDLHSPPVYSLRDARTVKMEIGTYTKDILQNRQNCSENTKHAHPLVCVSAVYECSCTVALAFFSMQTQESAGNAPAGVKANEVAEIKNQRQSIETLTNKCKTGMTAGGAPDIPHTYPHTELIHLAQIKRGNYTQVNGTYRASPEHERKTWSSYQYVCSIRYRGHGARDRRRVSSLESKHIYTLYTTPYTTFGPVYSLHRAASVIHPGSTRVNRSSPFHFKNMTRGTFFRNRRAC